MARPNSAGTFKVEFDFIDRTTHQPIDEEYRVPISPTVTTYEDRDGGRVIVDEPPILSNKTPYTGELTQQEYDWLTSLPGVEFNLSYRFRVTPVKKG